MYEAITLSFQLLFMHFNVGLYLVVFTQSSLSVHFPDGITSRMIHAYLYISLFATFFGPSRRAYDLLFVLYCAILKLSSLSQYRVQRKVD